ncbi:MAG: hypothetical protein ACTSSE_08600 [Candidatus Thorarchaeota archaeon]
MEIDKRLQKHYEGNIRCDLCERELDDGESVCTLQTGMLIEADGDDSTHVQFGGDQEVTVLCKECSPKVMVVVNE